MLFEGTHGIAPRMWSFCGPQHDFRGDASRFITIWARRSYRGQIYVVMQSANCLNFGTCYMLKVPLRICFSMRIFRMSICRVPLVVLYPLVLSTEPLLSTSSGTIGSLFHCCLCGSRSKTGCGARGMVMKRPVGVMEMSRTACLIRSVSDSNPGTISCQFLVKGLR